MVVHSKRCAMLEIKLCLIKWLSLSILRACGPELKVLFRKLEDVNIKLIKAVEHRKFNEQCLQHDLLPNYTNIRLHDARARGQRFVTNFRKELINRELLSLTERISQLSDQVLEIEEKLYDLSNSELRYEAFSTLINKTKEKTLFEQVKVHEKKLINLNGGALPIKQIPRVVNLTNERFSEDILDAFRLGLNCHLKTKSSKLSRQIELEKVYELIKTKENSGDLMINDDESLRTDLKQIGLREFCDFNKDLLSREQHMKLKEIKNSEKITIRRADKSNTIVILYTSDYTDKIDSILSDQSKFTKINKDPTDSIKRAWE